MRRKRRGGRAISARSIAATAAMSPIREACKALVEQVLADFGQIDILVNYAGVSHPDR